MPRPNPYLPRRATIEKAVIENDERDLKSFTVAFIDPEERAAFTYLPGQFAEVSVYGAGECPLGVASSPTEGDRLLFTVKRTGTVTDALHRLREGDVIGVRGPLGIPFPIERMKGRSVVVVGGGFAFTTLRSLAAYMLSPGNRADFTDLTVIYGARSPGELLYKEDLAAWGRRDDIRVEITVDEGDETWSGHEGFVPTLFERVAPSSANAMIVICGPPLMMKFTLPVAAKLGFAPEDILLSLEMRMKCGIGKCGRCNIGSRYVCVDGPAFTLAELRRLPDEY
ncbi:MAG: FAD/NAD(P)-binding protein [Candidatus Bipolaricaulota bacterium]|nr:MAG: FAD/NAD(P)-binding protein [Candidatus Bipolaricaulota bacterium]